VLETVGRNQAKQDRPMTTYRAPVRDMQFLLDDVLKIDRFNNLPGFSDAPRDVRSAILSEAARLSEEVLHEPPPN
jgi:hypothetical protein